MTQQISNEFINIEYKDPPTTLSNIAIMYEYKGLGTVIGNVAIMYEYVEEPSKKKGLLLLGVG
jgi:hypothetical protein